MTNQSTDSSIGRRRRYTVSRLLELAPHTRGIQFDLSKFTYDAARAGVVPPLGACVMSTRRTLSDQPRNWSQDSSSSADDVPVPRPNRIVKEGVPERQPKGPPSEHRLEQDKGFARFLKKHSSPTHQRVTAGGRIVPMEQRPRPPVYQLGDGKQSPEPERKSTRREGVAMKMQGLRLDTGVQVKPKADPDDLLQPQPQAQLQLPVKTAPMDHNALTAGYNVNIVPNNDTLAVDTTSAQSHWLAPMLPASVGPSVFPDPYYLHSPQLFPGYALPLSPPPSGFNGGFDGQFAMPPVHFPDVMGLPALGETAAMVGEPSPTGSSYFDQMVAAATLRFQELDRQLKTLDRHRAMSSRDPYLVEHRMAVVEMRANAKADISYWTNLAAGNRATSDFSVGAPSSTLNVEAASYVPLKPNPLDTTSISNSSNLLKGSDSTVQTTRPKGSPKAGRRRIPIVPPPEASASPMKKVGEDAPSQATFAAVDEWGVRVGNAPPELRRHQEEMAKALMRAASKSSHKSTTEGSTSSPAVSHDTSPLHDQSVPLVGGDEAENKREGDEWLPAKTGRAPPNIEASYELQLNALRLPKGIISKVRLPDGTVTEVRGQGLQRPPSLGMDDFERRYWKSKPVLTKEMTAGFIEMRPSGEAPLTDTAVEYLDFNSPNRERRATPLKEKENAITVLPSSSSGSSGGYAGNFKDVGKAHMGPPGHARELNKKEHHSAPFGSNGSDPSMSTFKQSSASSTPLWLRGDDRAAWFAGEHSQEAAVNKGFSSVSVQNVHAIGRLPHMLDGTTDSQRRSAMWMLSAAGKGRSPQRGHSATSASEAFGPTRRAGRGLGVESEDGVPRHFLKEEEK